MSGDFLTCATKMEGVSMWPLFLIRVYIKMLIYFLITRLILSLNSRNVTAKIADSENELQITLGALSKIFFCTGVPLLMRMRMMMRRVCKVCVNLFLFYFILLFIKINLCLFPKQIK